jgi:hypothetical protein
MEDSARGATTNKQLHVNQRVSGALGEYMEGPTKRCRHQRLYGHIISAVGKWKYLVHFDDGTEKECPSAVLKVEKVVANLPPDVQVPAPSNTVKAAEVQEAEDEIVDQDEEEALPEVPEVEEAEVTAELEGEEVADEDVEAADESQPSGMIGQLPTAQEAALASGKDYVTIEKVAWKKVKSEVIYFLSPTLTSSFTITSGKNVIHSEMDANGLFHYLVKYELKKDPSGWRQTKMRKCKLYIEGGKQCDVGQYCITCGESYSLCNKCDSRDCFDEPLKKFK